MKWQVKWEYAEMNEKKTWNIKTNGVLLNQCWEEIYTAEFLH